MKKEEKLMCRFCITSSICDGPHISSQKEEENISNYINNIKEDYIFIILQEIKKHSIKININLEELASIIKTKLEEK
jgi:UV DNA damage repair endonuclease